MRHKPAGAFAFCLMGALSASAAPLSTAQVAGGLNNPIFATYAPGDPTHLYVIEKENGATSTLGQPSFTQFGQGGVNTTTTLAKGTADIKVIDLSVPYNPANPGANVSTFLTIPNVNATQEMGLLGLAFDPNYATNGKFYVNVSGFSSIVTPNASPHQTTNSGNYGTQNIVEYHRSSGNPLVADSTPDGTLLSWENPYSAQHKAGWIGFSPQVNPSSPGSTIRAGDDHNLYISTGDGSLYPTGYDEFHTAQDPTSVLGKILRINVAPNGSGNNTAATVTIPNNNPYAAGGVAPNAANNQAVYAYGLRNPFRNSFDRQTGDLFIGDVGQDHREEVNVQLASQAGGNQNYEWSYREGTIATPAPTTTEVNGARPGFSSAGPGGPLTGAANESGPIFDYSHGVALDGSPDIASQMGLDSLAGKAVIGGYVYRGSKIPGLNGTYFLADLLGTSGATGSNIGDNNKAQIVSINYNDSTGVVTNLTDWTNQLNPGTSSTNQRIKGLVSFAEDASGELYLIDQATTSNTPQTSGNGSIWAIVATYLAGDFNRDGHVNAADILPMEQALTNLNDYKATYVPGITDQQLALIEDVNLDGSFNNADLQSFLNTLKSGGGSSAPIPEPSTFVLAFVAFGLLWCRFRFCSGQEQRRFALGVVPSTR